MSDIAQTESDFEAQRFVPESPHINPPADQPATSTNNSAEEKPSALPNESNSVIHRDLLFYSKETPSMDPGMYVLRPVNVPDGYFRLFVDEHGTERLVYYPHGHLAAKLRNGLFKMMKHPKLNLTVSPLIHLMHPLDPRNRG